VKDCLIIVGKWFKVELFHPGLPLGSELQLQGRENVPSLIARD